MPLPAPAAREEIHQRDILCRGYRRKDGLWDLEAHLTDKKTYPFKNRFRGEISIGEPLHEMWMRITIDDQFVIQDIVATSDKYPISVCGEIETDYRSLIGLRFGSGFGRKLAERVGGTKGCSHLSKLVKDLLVVALQTVGPLVYADFGEAPLSPVRGLRGIWASCPAQQCTRQYMSISNRFFTPYSAG